MSRRATSSSSVGSHRATDRDLRTQEPALRNACCLRCGGLLVTSFTAALERDVTGAPITLRRCVNCGDCLDAFILANRWKGPGPAGPRVGVPRGPQQTGRPPSAGIGMTR
ncbi:MAG: hypothetical protein Q8L74_08870 [Nitrospirota bacterium]|nr:hypothetical protein [Nitrospirota bacterium]MDP2382055.1 hypothetical protein [Nitrospirota bacterium]MDP3599490.1 hypothetical protein [Nitrospirota bacterium]